MRAVVVFVLDLTGSMQGLPAKIEKEIIFNIQSLLRATYKEVNFHFVGYDDVASEFPEEKIYRTFKGGGNTDSTGFILAKNILDKYPSSWNKYVYGFGDGGSFDTGNTIQALRNLYESCQHMGWGHVNAMTPGVPEFVNAIANLSKELPWFGFAQVNADQATHFRALKEFFGKKEEDQK